MGLQKEIWREDGTVDKICKRYGCKIHGKNEGLQAPHGSQLIQAILAIYAWIEFTDRTNDYQLLTRRKNDEQSINHCHPYYGYDYDNRSFNGTRGDR